MSALVRIHEITHHVGEGDGARHAAIYQHQYTINEGGVVRCQEQCSGGNFVRRAKSGGILHRLERLIHSRRVRRPAMKGRGFDYTRQNAVAANALLTEINCDSLPIGSPSSRERMWQAVKIRV